MARASVTTRVIDHGFNAEIENARRLNGRGVKVGIQAGQGAHEGTDLLDILIYNEFGTRYIPSRPVMRSYFDTYSAEIQKQSDNAATFVMRTGRLDLGLNVLGQHIQKGLQGHWRASKTWAVKNADATIEAKGSDVPLIDNGTLINSVRYQLL